MSLETRDGARLASLANDIHRLNETLVRALGTRDYPYLSHTDRHRYTVEFLIEGDQEPRVHGSYEKIEHPMILVQDN